LPRKQSHGIVEMVTGETDAADLLERGEGRNGEWKKRGEKFEAFHPLKGSLKIFIYLLQY